MVDATYAVEKDFERRLVRVKFCGFISQHAKKESYAGEKILCER